MFALMRLSEGLLFAHLCLAIAYLVGSNAMQWVRRDLSTSRAMLRVICTCALGFALIGFSAFALASAGLLTAPFAAAALAGLFFGGCALAKSSPLKRDYWSARWSDVAASFDSAHLLVYYAMLIVAFPEVNASNAGADPLAYHWAYALDFIHAHGLVVDPFLREPFYAANDLLLVTLGMLFGGAIFTQFFIWTMGLLTALGICAGVRSSFGDDDMWTSAIGVLLAGAAVYSPAYLRWLDSGYLDAALGFFALASVLSLRLALEEHGDSRWLNVCAALAAFLIGSKTSLLPFIAVYGFVLLAAARARKVSAKQTVLTLAILSALAAPWYVRNLVLAGDAIAPVLNILIFGHDGLFTKPEVQSIASDLHTDHGPRAIATLPLRAFLTPDTWDFREYGVSALMLLLYVPSLAVFAARFVLNRRPAAAVVWPVVLLTSMIAYWIFSSTVIRYSLLFYPLLALCCGIVATLLPRRCAPIVAMLAALTLVITPVAEAHTFYADFFINGVENPTAYYTSDEPFLQKFVDGYHEERFAASVLHRLNLRGRLYLIGNNVAYYYRRDGIESIGDWIGPAGAFRFYRATSTGRAADFLDALGVDAVVLDPARTLGGLDVPIERQLRAAGYCSVQIPESRMAFLLRPPRKVKCSELAAVERRAHR